MIDTKTRTAAVVDPVNPDAVLKAIEKLDVHLTTVLTTHHHWDHAGGNVKFVERFAKLYPDVKLAVYGGDDRIGALTNKVGQDDELWVGKLHIRCLFTPGHTSGHICYLVKAPNMKQCVFTGDTLFIAGSGRLFEGTAEQLYSAIIGQLSVLHLDTLIYCGHENTMKNLVFALQVEPNNGEVLKKLQWVKYRRQGAEKRPTVNTANRYICMF